MIKLNWKQLKDYKNTNEDTSDGFYHVGKDLHNFPDAWCIIAYSRRGGGKTYSGLWLPIYENFPIAYLKRTVEDVDTISTGSNTHNTDLSPYVPINRDKLTNIQPQKISSGLGAFYKCLDGEPQGDPISYIMALNKIKVVKGFEASRCKWVLLDEFIPQIGERINHREGEQLLDLYMTILRDKVSRGGEELKLILFANAEDISTPITRELDVIDALAELNNDTENNIYYLEDRGILLHHVIPEEIPRIQEQDKRLGIYRAMGSTAWGKKTFEGEFSNNDFSNVVKMSLKHMQGLCYLTHRGHDYYVYINNNTGMYYMTDSRVKCPMCYDLNLENDQKRFYNEIYFTLFDACVDDRMKFKSYSMYDLLINYKKFFKV